MQIFLLARLSLAVLYRNLHLQMSLAEPSTLDDEHIFESAEPCPYTSNIGRISKICKRYFKFLAKGNAL